MFTSDMSLEAPALTKVKPGSLPSNSRFNISAVGSPPVIHFHRTASFPLPLFFHQNTILRSGGEIPAVLDKNECAVTEQTDTPVRIVAVVGEGSVSPLKCATWQEVMLHTVSITLLVLKELIMPHQSGFFFSQIIDSFIYQFFKCYYLK